MDYYAGSAFTYVLTVECYLIGSTFFSGLDLDFDLDSTCDALGLATIFYSGYLTNDLESALLVLYSTSFTFSTLGYTLGFTCSFYFERDFCSTYFFGEALCVGAL